MSSILETGDGLFGTHVHLEDVNLVIKEQMKTESRLLEDSEMTVIGDGNGFCSKVILINCHWSIPESHLPQKLVLKIASFVHIQAMIENSKQEGVMLMSKEEQVQTMQYLKLAALKVHNQELNFYDIIKEGKSESLLAPKVYFYQRFSDENQTKGFIGMEFVEQSTARHTYQNCTREELQPILKAIAHIQALTFSISDDEVKKIEDGVISEQTSTTMLKEPAIKGILQHTRNIEKELLAGKVDQVEERYSEILNLEKLFNLNTIVGIPKKVFVHGDLWAANTLWTPEGHVCKILDYQLAHTGNPVEDLVRLMVTTLSGADRQKFWEEILDEFYDRLLEAMGNKDAPYTLEQLKDSYRHYLPVAGLQLLPMFGPAVDMKLKSMNEKNASKSKEIIVEKVGALLDDILTFHDSNQSK